MGTSEGRISVTVKKKLGDLLRRDFVYAYLCNEEEKVGRSLHFWVVWALYFARTEAPRQGLEKKRERSERFCSSQSS